MAPVYVYVCARWINVHFSDTTGHSSLFSQTYTKNVFIYCSNNRRHVQHMFSYTICAFYKQISHNKAQTDSKQDKVL